MGKTFKAYGGKEMIPKQVRNVIRRSLIVSLIPALILLFSVSVFANGSQEHSKGFVIALSNAYNGNAWRHQMERDFIASAKQAEAKGLVAKYVIDNSTNGLPGQLQQMDDLILQHVSAIVVDAASSTGLNGVIAKATKAGIPVISFDTGVTSPVAYRIHTSFFDWAKGSMQWVADHFHGDANVVIVRTQRGTHSDAQLMAGYMSVVKKYPGMKVVATIYGNADVTTTESKLSALIPSLPKVDAVMCAAGGFGAVQAFQAAGRPIPVVTSGLSSQFIHWWINEHEKNGYTTVGRVARPSESSAAFWAAVDLVHGQTVPKNMLMPTASVTQSNLMQFKDLPPNSFADTPPSNAWVKKTLLTQ